MSVIIDGTAGVTFNDASIQNTAATGFGFKNRIINGAMVIAQRGTAAVTGSGEFPVDRFLVGNTTDGAFSAQQDSSAPAGFINSVKLTTTTADATLATTQNLNSQHRIEGTNVADLGWGTANAKTVTLSFWVRSSLTGTFGGALKNSAENRSYPFTYSISVADTWEYKTITITGDTSGTWLATNGIGIIISFGLGAGPDRSGTAGAWNSNNNASATGAVSVIGTLNATWYITGVQLEKGSTATSFDYRPYGTELALCQRYTYALTTPGGVQYFMAGSGLFATTTAGFIGIPFPTPMRSIPSLSPAPTASNYQAYGQMGYLTLTALTLNTVTTSNFGLLSFSIASGGIAGQGCYLNSIAANSLPIIFSSEL
jgi:hypothetical protein